MTRFIKAHACGNDFLVVERAAGGEGAGDPLLAQQLCARTTGVGADGVEFLEWMGERAGRIRLFNADGSVAEISGNGTRCVAAWMAHSRQAGAGETVTLETDAGKRACRIVRVDGSRYEIVSGMGVPRVAARTVTLDEEGIAVEGAVVSTGNPHFVIFVEDGSFRLHGRSWQEIGSAICVHPDFPAQTNVEFVRVVDTDQIEIRIFERGVGPTSSSGTGTCAGAAATMTLGGAARSLAVRAPGGEQRVDWPAADAEMLLTGPAEIIAVGEAFA
jgi:diaminopimelate epimerase